MILVRARLISACETWACAAWKAARGLLFAAGVDLLLFSGRGEIAQRLPPLRLGPLHLKVGSPHPLLRRGGIERGAEIEGVDDVEQVALMHELIVDDVRSR